MAVDYSPEEIYKLLEKATRKEINKPEILSLYPKPPTDKERILGYLDTFIKSEGFSSLTEERITRLEKEIGRIDFLEKQLCNLREKIEDKKKLKKKKTIADIIYDKNRAELESKHFGKIVAMESDSGKIVGLGNNMVEAYKNAREKSTKTAFVFKKIGHESVISLR